MKFTTCIPPWVYGYHKLFLARLLKNIQGFLESRMDKRNKNSGKSGNFFDKGEIGRK